MKKTRIHRVWILVPAGHHGLSASESPIYAGGFR